MQNRRLHKVTTEEIEELAQKASEPEYVKKTLVRAARRPFKLYQEVSVLDRDFTAGRIHNTTVRAVLLGLRSMVVKEGGE